MFFGIDVTFINRKILNNIHRSFLPSPSGPGCWLISTSQQLFERNRAVRNLRSRNL